MPKNRISSSAAKPKTSAHKIDPLDWAKLSEKIEPVRREIDAVVRRKRRRRIQAAGAALVLVGMATLLWTRRAESTRLPASSIASLPVRQVLPDDSVVETKDGARIVVDYSGPLRRVTLEQGEAHFQVEKNQDRPFVVEVDGVTVRAVGTAFLVQRHAATVEVVVTEGRVAIDRKKEGDPVQPSPRDIAPLAFVDAGNRLVVPTQPNPSETAPAVQALSPAELEQRMAWRVPRLEFNSTPLSEVLPAFNQHGGVRLSLADPELGKLELSGVLRADNVAALLKILESSYGLKPEQRSETEIELRKGP